MDPMTPDSRPPQVPDDLPPANGIAIAALVLGIVAYPLLCAHPIVAMTIAVLAVLFGFMGRRNALRGAGGGGMATGGAVLGMLVIGLSIMMLVGCLAALGLGGLLLHQAGQSGTAGLG